MCGSGDQDSDSLVWCQSHMPMPIYCGHEFEPHQEYSRSVYYCHIIDHYIKSYFQLQLGQNKVCFI